MSQRYDPSHFGENMPPQFVNLTPNSDRVTESHTWKQLVQKGEQAEEIVARVKTEEGKSRPEKSTKRMPEASFQAKRKDKLATETRSLPKPQPTRGVVLQTNHTPTSSTPSRTRMLIHYLSYSIRATD